MNEFLNEKVAPLLKRLHQPLDEWIGGLPSWAGVACAVGLFVLAGLWVLTLKREYVYVGAPDRRRWRDLRLWALLVLLPYIIIYLVL